MDAHEEPDWKALFLRYIIGREMFKEPDGHYAVPESYLARRIKEAGYPDAAITVLEDFLCTSEICEESSNKLVDVLYVVRECALVRCEYAVKQIIERVRGLETTFAFDIAPAAIRTLGTLHGALIIADEKPDMRRAIIRAEWMQLIEDTELSSAYLSMFYGLCKIDPRTAIENLDLAMVKARVHDREKFRALKYLADRVAETRGDYTLAFRTFFNRNPTFRRMMITGPLMTAFGTHIINQALMPR